MKIVPLSLIFAEIRPIILRMTYHFSTATSTAAFRPKDRPESINSGEKIPWKIPGTLDLIQKKISIVSP